MCHSCSVYPVIANTNRPTNSNTKRGRYLGTRIRWRVITELSSGHAAFCIICAWTVGHKPRGEWPRTLPGLHALRSPKESVPESCWSENCVTRGFGGSVIAELIISSALGKRGLERSQSTHRVRSGLQEARAPPRANREPGAGQHAPQERANLGEGPCFLRAHFRGRCTRGEEARRP